MNPMLLMAPAVLALLLCGCASDRSVYDIPDSPREGADYRPGLTGERDTRTDDRDGRYHERARPSE